MKFNKKTKYCLVLGIIITTVFSIMIVPSMAAMVQKQILVSTGVNIYIDDVTLNPVDSSGNPVDAFIYNGTTYLPVRAIADAVGKSVFWDEKTKSVYLGQHDQEKSDAINSGSKMTKPEVIWLDKDYDYISYFWEGLAVAESKGKCGYIDKTGKEVIPLKYDCAQEFSEGLASVCLNNKFGFIDKAGKEVIPLKYDFADTFNEGTAMVRLKNKGGFINKAGKEITPLKYDTVYGFVEGIARVDLNDKFGYIDKTGKEITPIKYMEGEDCPYPYWECVSCEGQMSKLNGKWNYINYKTGEEISLELDYDNVSFFQGDLAKVKLNEKYGYINKAGEEVIPVIYDEATDFRDGIAIVKLNGKWGIMKFLL